MAFLRPLYFTYYLIEALTAPICIHRHHAVEAGGQRTVVPFATQALESRLPHQDTLLGDCVEKKPIHHLFL